MKESAFDRLRAKQQTLPWYMRFRIKLYLKWWFASGGSLFIHHDEEGNELPVYRPRWKRLIDRLLYY